MLFDKGKLTINIGFKLETCDFHFMRRLRTMWPHVVGTNQYVRLCPAVMVTFLKYEPLLKLVPCCPFPPCVVTCGQEQITSQPHAANVSNANVNGFLWKLLRADQSDSFFILREIYRLSPQRFYPPCSRSPRSLIVGQTPGGARKTKTPGAILSGVTNCLLQNK